MISHTKHSPTSKVISAYYTVHPDDRQAFSDAVIPHLTTTAHQDGCTYYVFAEDLTDPNTIHLTEGWRDQAASTPTWPMRTSSRLLQPSSEASASSTTRPSTTTCPRRQLAPSPA